MPPNGEPVSESTQHRKTLSLAFAGRKQYLWRMPKKRSLNPRVERQGGPKINRTVRVAPALLEEIQRGAAAAGETETDTFVLGALRRARASISRAALQSLDE